MIRYGTHELKGIVAEATQSAEQRGYTRGWNDAIEAFKKLARGSNGEATTGGVTVTMAAPVRRRRGGKPNKSGGAVLKAITDMPGMTGARIADHCPEIHERTVRTALRRLRLAGKIEQRDGAWFAVSGD